MINKNSQLKKYLVLFACVIAMALTMGMITTCSGIFIQPMSEDLGKPRADLAGLYSMYSIGQVIIFLLADKIYKKFNMIGVMKISAVIISICFVIMSNLSSVFMLKAFALIIGLGIGGICMMPIPIIVRSWFREKSGTAIGIAMAGSGAGGMICSYLLTKYINVIGWRMCYKIFALCCFFILVPVIFIFIKEDKSCEINVESNAEFEPNACQRHHKSENLMMFNFLFAAVLIHTPITMVNQNIVPYLTENHLSVSLTAQIASACMCSLMIGKIILGYIYDKVSAKKGTLICSACVSVALWAILFPNSALHMILYLPAYGIGQSFGTVVYPIMAKYLFDGKDYIKRYGICTAVNSLALSAGSVITCAAYDSMGSYTPIFKLFLGLSIFAFVIYFAVIPEDR